jgi:outer membrane lipoprotein carrier protein
MARLSRLFLVFPLLFSLNNVCADDLSASQLLGEILRPLQSLSAEFKQTLFDENGNVFETSRGFFSIAQTNRVRWTTLEPMSQQIISNGQVLWIYDPDLEQVIIQSYSSDLKSSPAILFSGHTQQFSENFDITYRRGEKGIDSYFLAPKSASALYRSLRIDFHGHKPVLMEFVDALQQVTRVEFNSVTINPILEDSLFEFTIPPGIDVINHVK